MLFRARPPTPVHTPGLPTENKLSHCLRASSSSTLALQRPLFPTVFPERLGPVPTFLPPVRLILDRLRQTEPIFNI